MFNYNERDQCHQVVEGFPQEFRKYYSIRNLSALTTECFSVLG